MKNIFLIGKAGAGKTTIAEYLIRKHGYLPAKFAYPVYMIAEKYFGMKKKDRHLLQIIGTEGGRSLDENIWINRLLQDLEIVEKINKEYFGKEKTLFVLDDCRFENEVKALLNKGWIGIYVDCKPEIRRQRLIKRDGYDQGEYENHSSEAGITEIYEKYKNKLLVVNNSGSLDELFIKIESLLEEVL